MELSPYQLLYIQTVYEYFRENLQWPTFRQVQRKILPTHRDFRVLEVAKSIEDNQAAHFHNNLGSSAAITLKEIHQLPQAQQDLSDLLKVIHYSVKKYLTEDEDGVRVTSDEIRQKLHFEEATIRKVYQLLGLTTGITGSGGFSVDYKTWNFEVSDSAIDFQDLESVDDYFARRDEIRKLHQASQLAHSAIAMNQYLGTSASVVKQRISQEVVNAISDSKIKQICTELNNTPDENVLSLAQGIGEALKWTLWYRAQQVGTSMTVSTMKMSRLLDDAINSYYSGNATVKFLKDFKYGFLKTGYDMVRHDSSYIPNSSAFGPAIDALEHIFKETFPI